jgi:hypothetical protein
MRVADRARIWWREIDDAGLVARGSCSNLGSFVRDANGLGLCVGRAHVDTRPERDRRTNLLIAWRRGTRLRIQTGVADYFWILHCDFRGHTNPVDR